MTGKFRICFLAPGASIHTRRWVEALAGRGHQVLLITQDPAPSIAADVFNPYQSMGRLARLTKIRVLITEQLIHERVRAFAPDIVHLHWLNPVLGTLWIVRRLEPLVVSVWGRDLIWDGSEPEPRVRLYCKKRILARARVVTATSNFLARRTRPYLPPKTDVLVVPFGVDCAVFRPTQVEPRRSVPVVGFLKHFTPKYGPDVLLRAASLLTHQGVEFRVEMHGTCDPEPYRRLAAELDLGETVTISGEVEHARVPEILRRFDIYAMPSVHDSETFGVAALEASASGLPVVASRVGGVPEVVLDGISGCLVNPSDPAELAAALRSLIEDPALRSRMGNAGRQHALRSFRWEACVDQMEGLYTRVRAPLRGGTP